MTGELAQELEGKLDGHALLACKSNFTTTIIIINSIVIIVIMNQHAQCSTGAEGVAITSQSESRK